MADDKKPESVPPTSGFSHPDPFVEVVWTILAVLLIIYVINGIISVFLSDSFSSSGPVFWFKTHMMDILLSIFYYLKYIMVLLSVGLAFWIMDFYKKVVVLRKAESALLYVETAKSEKVGNPMWERILKNSDSLNENDWRLAIIEADIMLDELLEKMGLVGETIGDRLKTVQSADFKTIDAAWEAHKIRNQIAHEGGEFIINQHETKRVIGLYESVFQEFKVI